MDINIAIQVTDVFGAPVPLAGTLVVAVTPTGELLTSANMPPAMLAFALEVVRVKHLIPALTPRERPTIVRAHVAPPPPDDPLARRNGR